MKVTNLADNLSRAIKKHSFLLVYIKGSPDPDAIATSFAFYAISASLGTPCLIYSRMQPSLRQNRMLVDSLNIPIIFGDRLPDLSQFSGYVILDHPSNFEKEISSLRCAVHLDHHSRSEECVDADFSFIEDDVNSLSSVFAFLLERFGTGMEESALRRVATALQYGILTDTDRMERATEIDTRASVKLSRHSDHLLIEELINLPYSGETHGVILRAMRDNLVYKDWLISGVGYLDEINRDAIAIAADYLLEKNEFETVVVFAIIKRPGGGLFLDASFRTRSALLDLNNFIKSITPYGGARAYKGAYQIDLDYFAEFGDRELLWTMVSSVTLDHIRHGRNTLRRIGVTDIFSKIGSKIRTIFTRGHTYRVRDDGPDKR